MPKATNFIVVLLHLCGGVDAFTPAGKIPRNPFPQAVSIRPTNNVLKDRRLQQEIDENSRRRARGGTGETAAGAILGGLLLGPFGT